MNMNPILLYIPIAAGLAMLVALLVIRLKEVRSNAKAIMIVAAGVSVVQLFGGLFFVATQPGIGIVSIVMALITMFAAVRVYNTMRPQWNNAEGPSRKIEKMIKDYNDVLIHTTNIIERERIKSEISKLKQDLNSQS